MTPSREGSRAKIEAMDGWRLVGDLWHGPRGERLPAIWGGQDPDPFWLDLDLGDVTLGGVPLWEIGELSDWLDTTDWARGVFDTSVPDFWQDAATSGAILADYGLTREDIPFLMGQGVETGRAGEFMGGLFVDEQNRIVDTSGQVIVDASGLAQIERGIEAVSTRPGDPTAWQSLTGALRPVNEFLRTPVGGILATLGLGGLGLALGSAISGGGGQFTPPAQQLTPGQQLVNRLLTENPQLSGVLSQALTTSLGAQQTVAQVLGEQAQRELMAGRDQAGIEADIRQQALQTMQAYLGGTPSVAQVMPGGGAATGVPPGADPFIAGGEELGRTQVGGAATAFDTGLKGGATGDPVDAAVQNILRYRSLGISPTWNPGSLEERISQGINPRTGQPMSGTEQSMLYSGENPFAQVYALGGGTAMGGMVMDQYGRLVPADQGGYVGAMAGGEQRTAMGEPPPPRFPFDPSGGGYVGAMAGGVTGTPYGGAATGGVKGGMGEETGGRWVIDNFGRQIWSPTGAGLTFGEGEGGGLAQGGVSEVNGRLVFTPRGGGAAAGGPNWGQPTGRTPSGFATPGGVDPLGQAFTGDTRGGGSWGGGGAATGGFRSPSGGISRSVADLLAPVDPRQLAAQDPLTQQIRALVARQAGANLSGQPDEIGEGFRRSLVGLFAPGTRDPVTEALQARVLAAARGETPSPMLERLEREEMDQILNQFALRGPQYAESSAGIEKLARLRQMQTERRDNQILATLSTLQPQLVQRELLPGQRAGQIAPLLQARETLPNLQLSSVANVLGGRESSALSIANFLSNQAEQRRAGAQALAGTGRTSPAALQLPLASIASIPSITGVSDLNAGTADMNRLNQYLGLQSFLAGEQARAGLGSGIAQLFARAGATGFDLARG